MHHIKTKLTAGRFSSRTGLRHYNFSRANLVIVTLVVAGIGGYLLLSSSALTSSVGDANNDGQVNVTDLSILLNKYGTTDTSTDFNQDGTVTVTDLSILLSHYGTSVGGGSGSSQCGSSTLGGVWTVESMYRIRPDTAAGTAKAAALYSAKGEYESYQVAIKGPSTGLTNVNAVATDLTGSSGTISASNVTLYREQFVNLTTASPASGGTNQSDGAGWWPDGLIPFNDPETGAPLSGAQIDAAPFSVAASKNQVVWVDVFVPRTAAAGLYNGSLNITSSQGNFCVPVSLNVWNFTLPLKPTEKSSFSFWTSQPTAAYKELLRNKVMSGEINIADGTLLRDQFGLNEASIGYWSGANNSTCTMNPPPSVATIQSKVAQFPTGVSLHDYSADEVGSCSSMITSLQSWARNLHAAGVDQLVTMSPRADLFSDGSGTGRSAVDIWVMLPEMYNATSSTLLNQALSKGDELWSYNALIQDSYSPKWTIDYPPLNFRLMSGFIGQSLNLTGFLDWRIDLWTSDPWNNVNTYTIGSSVFPGDGMFVYPGSQVGISGVAPSMRLKWLRDGVDDYEYVQLLKAKGQTSFAMTEARSVGANWSTWSHDPAAVDKVRLDLGNALSL